MKTVFLPLIFLAALPVSAQQMNHVHPDSAQAQHSAYAEMTSRSIKSLSDEQIADIRAGKGMSLALAAELNGYPGPAHALELAEHLGLTAVQKQQTERLKNDMLAEVKRLGEEWISSEAELDKLFKLRRAAAAEIAAHAEKVGRALGALRAAHLQYHVNMLEVLTPSQVAKYNALRGYAKRM